MTDLRIVPTTLKEANALVLQLHRHHPPAVGHRWSLGVADEDGVLHGVAIVSRPVARGNDNGRTAEVVRVATDGTPNACSMLYGAARRAAKALGFDRLITYTLASEPGTSLRASGWIETGTVRGRSWTTPSRPREDVSPTVDKIRWEAVL